MPPGSLAEDRLGEERGHEVSRDELAGVVDEEAAVSVSVVGDAEIGALAAGPLHDEGAVLREERVRLVVRKRAVRLEVAARDLELRQALEHGRKHRAGHPVRRVDDDSQRPDRVHVDEREHLVDEARPHVLLADLAAARDGAEAGRGAGADLVQPESPPTGSAPRRTIFMPVYCFGLWEAVTQMPPSSPSSPTA